MVFNQPHSFYLEKCQSNLGTPVVAIRFLVSKFISFMYLFQCVIKSIMPKFKLRIIVKSFERLSVNRNQAKNNSEHKKFLFSRFSILCFSMVSRWIAVLISQRQTGKCGLVHSEMINKFVTCINIIYNYVYLLI